MRPEFVELRNHPEVTVLIIGGGINGIGLFNELALQGIDVLLADKSDFCSGTSAAMTRIIHGGLRYLENAEFRLVREALQERNRLLKNAPHYVKPMPTVIPIFNWMAGIVPGIRNLLNWPTKPGNRGALLIKTGLTLYEFLAGRKSPLPRHRFNSGRAARALRPALNPGVICTATYYDAKITYPERLCLELVQDAEAACPQAHAMNYVRMMSAKGDTVLLRDEISGETCEVKPKIVVNATGPWIDGANQTIGCASQFIGGTKGSHIVLDHPELVAATGDDMIYFVNRDGRICLFYVIEGKVFAGATDIPTGDPDAACDEVHQGEPRACCLPHLRRTSSAAQQCVDAGPDQPRPQLSGAARGQRNRFSHLLAGERQVDHLSRARRAGCRRDSAGVGPRARKEFG
jgi:glycerol-3-phosphate dehydrogenase